jgi:hypothetical protein
VQAAPARRALALASGDAQMRGSTNTPAGDCKWAGLVRDEAVHVDATSSTAAPGRIEQALCVETVAVHPLHPMCADRAAARSKRAVVTYAEVARYQRARQGGSSPALRFRVARAISGSAHAVLARAREVSNHAH